MMAAERFVLVDVGCIECGEQTEIVGVFDTQDEAVAIADEYAKKKNITDWEPRGGILEFCGLYGKEISTYLGGCGYFDGGQHAIELHVFPARKIERKIEGGQC